MIHFSDRRLKSVRTNANQFNFRTLQILIHIGRIDRDLVRFLCFPAPRIQFNSIPRTPSLSLSPSPFHNSFSLYSLMVRYFETIHSSRHHQFRYWSHYCTRSIMIRQRKRQRQRQPLIRNFEPDQNRPTHCVITREQMSDQTIEEVRWDEVNWSNSMRWGMRRGNESNDGSKRGGGCCEMKGTKKWLNDVCWCLYPQLLTLSPASVLVYSVSFLRCSVLSMFDLLPSDGLLDWLSWIAILDRNQLSHLHPFDLFSISLLLLLFDRRACLSMDRLLLPFRLLSFSSWSSAFEWRPQRKRKDRLPVLLWICFLFFFPIPRQFQLYGTAIGGK